MAQSEAAAGGKPQYKNSSKWLMLVLVCLVFFLVNGFIYQSFNLFLRTIAIDLGWSDAERAVVASGYATGLVWFVFVAGIALDRFSVKKLLGSFCLASSVLVFLRSTITSAAAYATLMIVYGAACAFIIPALGKVLGLWFSSRELALANGCQTAASPLGQVTGNMLGVPIATALGGWQNLFILQAILMAVLAIVILIFGKDRRNIDAALASNTIASEEELGIWKNFKAVVKVPQMWMYIIANAGLLGMIYAGGSQGQVVLQGDPKWNLDPSISGIVPSSNNIASMICYILMPLIIKKFFAKNYEKNYKVIAIISGIIASFGYFFGYRSYNLVFVCISAGVIAGICFGSAVPAPRVLMLQLPEVSGPRAGTALGVYLTVERLAQAIMTGAIGGFIAMYPDDMGNVLSKFWLIMLVSPIMLTISLFIDKNQARKTTAPA